MKLTEQVTVSFGTVSRLTGEDDSPVLSQLPNDIYPNPEPGCATCPGADWYLTAKHLRCFCKEHRVISWVSNDDPVMVCDARERLIEEAESDRRAGASATGDGQ